MGNEVQALLSAVIQILFFTLLPFIWWLVTARRKSPFLEWIGLKPLKETGSQKTWLWILLGSIFFLVFSIFVLYAIRNLETAMSRFSGLGFKALPSILIYSIFQTALPEEMCEEIIVVGLFFCARHKIVKECGGVLDCLVMC